MLTAEDVLPWDLKAACKLVVREKERLQALYENLELDIDRRWTRCWTSG